MSRAWLLPPHYRKNSLFRTTYRNALVYWLSNLIIFPAYLICMFVLINAIPLEDWFNTSNLAFVLKVAINTFNLGSVNFADVVRIIAWIFALFPLVNTSLVPRHYHHGLRHRRWLLFVALIIIISWILFIDLSNIHDNARNFLWIINISLHGLVIFFIFNTWKLRRYLFLGSIALVGLGAITYVFRNSIPESIQFPLSILIVIAVIALFLFYFRHELLQSIIWIYKKIPRLWKLALSFQLVQKNQNFFARHLTRVIYAISFSKLIIRKTILKYFSWVLAIFPFILALLAYFILLVLPIYLFSIIVLSRDISFISPLGIYYYSLIFLIVISLGEFRDPLGKLYDSSLEQEATKQIQNNLSLNQETNEQAQDNLSQSQEADKKSSPISIFLQHLDEPNGQKAIVIGSLFVFYFIAVFNNFPLAIIAIMGILALISASSTQFFSRQKAYWLYHSRHIRYDMIQTSHSPLTGFSHWVNILFQRWLPSILDFNNRRLYLILSIIIGGIGLPLLVLSQNETNTTVDILGLLLISVAGATSFITIYFVLYAINNRSRYIVNRFTINDPQTNGDSSPELAAVANLTTSLLTEELQRTAVLLEMRQTENVNFSPDDNNAFFVTAGLDQNFSDQIQQIVTVEVPQKGVVNFGPLLSIATKLMANIVVEGKVQRRTNGSLEVWVHMNHGKQGSIAIEHTLVPENNIAEIDEVLLRPVLRQIAIKLFIEMGEVTHLSSTEDSMSDLLNGLDASANRNWWRAIAYYRRILNTEETLRSSYGIGHYHLGAALIFQGDWKLGLEHLRTAELDGPRIPETQYMLALSLLYLYWSQLHKRRNVFNQIESYINVAITLRPNFPEAYQLLGTAFYRRARQIEVDVTRPPEEDSKFKPAQYQYAYRQAVKCLSKALAQYDSRQRLQTKAPNFYNVAQNVARNYSQQRMTAAHLLGDALRGLELYTEAESYYRTVDLILPRNPRNLNDLVKTLCLSGNWQHAEEFLWRKVFVHDIAWWDADSCFHMGWTILGGIFDSKQTDDKAVVRHKINALATDWYDYRIKDEKNISNVPVYQFAEAMKYLDYALHQRPRYITYWHQTDWASPFFHVAEKLTGSRDLSKLYNSSDDSISLKYVGYILSEPIMANETEHKTLIKSDRSEQEKVIIQRLAVRNQLWIALRLDSYAQQNETGSIKKQLILWGWDKAVEEAIGTLSEDEDQNASSKSKKEAYENLKLNRNRVLNYLKMLQKAPRSTGLILGYVRLYLAQELLGDWEDCKKAFSDFIEKTKEENSPPPTLLDRWHLEIYAETAMLTLRSLAEAEYYEKVFEIANEACDVMSNWVRWWRKCYRSEENTNQHNHHQTFTPRVSRYHHTSFYAWKAFGLYHCMFDKSAKIRCRDEEILAEMVGCEAKEKLTKFVKKPSSDVAINAMQDYIKSAREHIHHHPLTMYMQGLIYQRQNLYSKAVEEYEGLIDLVSPYDPKTQIGIDNLPVGDYLPDEPLAESGDRTRMYYMERVCGRQQFYNTVSLPKIHNAIAECYKQMNKPLLRVDHLLEAIRQSPNNDQRIDNFLQLAYQLNNIERHKEAEAILEAIQSPLNQLGDARVATSIYQIPDVLAAVVQTRAKNYAASMNYARKFARKLKLSVEDFTDENLDAQQKMLKLLINDFSLDGIDDLDDQKIKPSKDSFDRHFEDAKIRLKTYELRNKANRTKIKTYGAQIKANRAQIKANRAKDTLKEVFSLLLHKAKSSFKTYKAETKASRSKDTLKEVFSSLFHKEFDDKVDDSKQIENLGNLIKKFTEHKDVKFSAKPADYKILKIFQEIRDPEGKFDWNALNKAAKGARIVLNDDDRAILFKILRKPKSNNGTSYALTDGFRIIMESNVTMYLSREYSNKLSQFSELCNTLAYNRAETGQHLVHAYYDSAVAISVMSYLIHTTTQGSDVRRTFELKQAQFLDTFGWARYRNFLANAVKINPFNLDEIRDPNTTTVNAFSGSRKSVKPREYYEPEQLRIAEKYLRSGIRYHHERAIIHYHLSRLYLTRVETLWQRVPEIYNPDVAKFAPVIDTSITESFRHLRNAREFDRFKRLHMQISWLSNRIRMYKLAWEKRQFRGIAGDDKADSSFFELGGISHIE